MNAKDPLAHLGKGKWGESHAEAEIGRLFIAAKPTPDIGSDLIGQFRPECGPVNVTFHFQTKTGVRSTVAANTLARWIDIVESQPVVIVKVEEVSFGTQHYSVVLFHDWLLDHPSYAALARPVAFRPQDYTPVRDDAEFSRLMLLEADRALHRQAALFQYAHIREIPLRERDALAVLGRLRHAELSADLIHQFEIDPTTRSDEDLWQRLVAGHTISSLSDQVPVDEHRQFADFVHAMRSLRTGELVRMPPAKYSAVSVWRPLVALFPAALDLLERVIATSSGRSALELRATFQLLGSLSNSSDGTRARRAQEILRAARNEFDNVSVNNYQQFSVCYAYKFALAESEGAAHVDHLIDFLNRDTATEKSWVLRLNREYYGAPDAVTATALLSQRVFPRTRNLKTMKVQDFLIETLPLPFDDALRSLPIA